MDVRLFQHSNNIINVQPVGRSKVEDATRPLARGSFVVARAQTKQRQSAAKTGRESKQLSDHCWPAPSIQHIDFHYYSFACLPSRVGSLPLLEYSRRTCLAPSSGGAQVQARELRRLELCFQVHSSGCDTRARALGLRWPASARQMENKRET